MKYMRLDYIKLHSRIDYNDEDGLLELYADSAEQTVLNYLNRTYEDVVETWGAVPEPVRQATLMLVDLSYQQRSPVSQQNMSVVPYGFDALLKPYMRLSSGECPTPYSQVVLGSQIKIPFRVDLPHHCRAKNIGFSIVVRNFSDKDKHVKFKKKQCIRLGHNEYAVPVDTEALGIGLVRLKLTLHIPDRDFPGGYRKEVVDINPRISIKG